MTILRAYREAFRGLSREIWLLAGVSLINRSGTMVIPFLTLYLTSQHGFEPAQAGGMLALYGVGAIGGISAGGRLTDRVGALSVQVASLLLSGLTFFLLGTLDVGPGLTATVVALGFINESFRPANSAAIAHFSTAENRTRAFGLHRLALNLGMTAGPVAGGFLAQHGYGLLFWVDGATCLVAGLVLGVAFKARSDASSARSPERAGVSSPWRDRTLIAVLVLLFVQSLVFFQFMSTLPLYLREVRGFGEGLVGTMIAVNTVVIIAFEMILIRAVRRARALRLVAFASVCVGVGFGMLPLASSVAWIALSVVVWTVGEMLTSPVMSAWVANRAPDASRGRYLGAFTLCFSLGTVAGPAAGTLVYQHWGPDALWLGCLVIGGVTALGFLALSASGRAEIGSGAGNP